MLKKIHVRLTFLCTFVIGIILIMISIIYLFLSERSMNENYYDAFQKNTLNIISSLENQTIISHSWLSSIEASGDYLAFLEDNETPLFFDHFSKSEEQMELLAEIKTYYENEFSPGSSTSFSSYHKEFIYSKNRSSFFMPKEDYYVSFAEIPREQGKLNAYVLLPLSSLYGQLNRQRALFLFINLLAIGILFLFFLIFIKRLLRPIQENQKKQVQFVASASHELRTPLSVILSCASLIPKSDLTEQDDLCNTIKSEGKRMKRLLEDMLLLAHSDNYEFSIQKTENELDTLLLDCFEAFEPLAKEKQIKLNAILPEDKISPCICDKNRIKQVVFILLHNAISYTPENGIVAIELSLSNGLYQLSVSDTGVGVPDKDKKRIFERFYRADSSRSIKGHFGLGLSIAYEIVKGHKGTLQVADTPGGGSTFIIRLP